MIVTLADTLGIQKKVRNALARHNFQIKEIDAIDTIQTFSAEVKGIPGYAIITAVISGTNVQLNGFYGFRRSYLFGYTTQPRNDKPIIYYDGSKMWHLLLNIAGKMEPAGMFYEK